MPAVSITGVGGAEEVAAAGGKGPGLRDDPLIDGPLGAGLSWVGVAVAWL